MSAPTLIYPSDDKPKRLPASLAKDLQDLFDKVRDWRSVGVGDDHYRSVATSIGFQCEGRYECLNKKKTDLSKFYDTDELSYGVVIEIETSTIENVYNDLLKVMQLLKAGDVDYGIVVCIENDRANPRKLTVGQLNSNLRDGLTRVLDDFRGKLFIYHMSAT